MQQIFPTRDLLSSHSSCSTGATKSGKTIGVSFRFLASPAEILGDGKAETLKIELMELRGGKPAGTGRSSTATHTVVSGSIATSACGMATRLPKSVEDNRSRRRTERRNTPGNS